MNIYVGNLAYDVTEENLRTAFEKYGEVSSCKIIKDKMGGGSKGFGFVEMPKNSEADTAMKALNGSMMKEKPIKISEARPKSNKKRRGRRF